MAVAGRGFEPSVSVSSTVGPTPPGDEGFAAEFARGMGLYHSRDYERAGAIFLALSRRPDAAPVVPRMLGLCHVRSGAYEAGLRLLSHAFGLAPTDPETRLHYGIGLLAAGRAAEAAAQFRACVPLMPRDPAPPLNLAAALLTLGDTAGALLAARKAKLRVPEMAEAHYTLGLAELAAGQLVRAADAFTKATTLAPQFAEAWVNLGLVRYRQGDITQAQTMMARALREAPGHKQATANLAVFLRLAGEVEQAETLLRNTVEAGGDNAEARVNLATMRLAEDRPAEALALLEAPPPRDRTLALHWAMQRVLALSQLGRVEEAQALLDDHRMVPPAFEPMLLWRTVLLAQADRAWAAAQTSAERLEKVLAESRDVLPEHRIMGYFDLGRFWTGRGEPDRAFPSWAAGHRQLARFQPFSRRGYQAFVDANRRRFDRSRLARGPRGGNTDPAPVFIVGMPRSGTTLTEQILAAHGSVHGAGERNALARLFHRLGGAMETSNAVARIVDLDAGALDAAAEHYLTALHALDRDAARVVDKMPGNFRYLGLTGLLLPGAKIIHCLRDPRDIALSIFTFRFFGHHPYAHDIADLGWYIGQYRRLTRHWEAVLPNPILTIRLRDWIEDFDGTLRHLLRFLDLPYDPACARFHELNRKVLTVSQRQVRSPVNARGLGRWRAYARHLEPMIDELRRCGFDPDEW